MDPQPSSPRVDQPTLRRRIPSVVEQEALQRPEDLRAAAPPAAGRTGLLSAAARGVLRSLFIHLVVFAVVLFALFFYSAGEPVLAGWSMSLFVVIYMFGCSFFYSTPATALGNIFLALSYVGLLAFLVGMLVSSVLAMVVMYMDSFLAAGLFGSVLAQRRLYNGSEMAALDAVAYAPPGKYRRQLGVYFFLAALALFYAICWVMLSDADDDASTIALNLFGAIAFLLFIQIICLLGWLNGAVLGHDSSPPVVAWFTTVAMLTLVFYLLAGELIAVIVLWLCILVSTAFLGYYLQVYAKYAHLMIISEPAMPSFTTDGSAADPSTTDGSAPAPSTTDGSAPAPSTTLTNPATDQATTDGSAAAPSTTLSNPATAQATEGEGNTEATENTDGLVPTPPDTKEESTEVITSH